MASRRLVLAALAALISSPPARADGYPDHPIALVVPFPAGGSTDIIGRLFAAKMRQALGQPVLVENKGGAGGNVGSTEVARAAPDGYTILMATVATHALNPAVYAEMPYDPVADFAPVSLLVIVPNVLVVHPSVPATTVTELVALLKANPGAYSYASPGNGTPGHLSGEWFKTATGTAMAHVPYEGAGPALNDVIAGHVPIMFDNVPSSLQHMQSGQLRGLAVTTKERAPSMPDLPTMEEAGIPGYETYSWNALFAPAGTPPEIVAKVNEAAVTATRDPELLARLAELGATPVGSTPDELAAHVEAELAKWAPI